MLLTSKELANKLNIEYLEANRFLKLLTSIGVASEFEKVKQEGRGRPTIRYEVPSSIKINFEHGEVRENKGS
tara:strand:+ start:14563 stop:14778 length:216 start_codon:yes stop_codon:yes gene_type:complete